MDNTVLVSSGSAELAPEAAETRVAPSGERVPILDGIRGLAILLVMFFHFRVFGTAAGTQLWERAYSNVAGMGWIGVDLFFVLSGFLITGILYDSRKSLHYFRVFYGRRTLRIFPLYYATLAVFFALMWVLQSYLHHPEALDMPDTATSKLFAWTYLLNWYEGFKGFDSVPLPLQHFWSLAIEEQFYLIWPFLVLKLARRRLMTLCAVLVLMGLSLRAILYWLHMPVAAYTWTFCRADALAIGAFIALSARSMADWQSLLRWAKRLALPSFAALILLRVINPQSDTGPGSSPTFSMGVFEIALTGIFFGTLLAIAISLAKEHPMQRCLASPFLRFFGKYSYCLYICHLPIIVVLAKAGLHTTHLSTLFQNEFLAILIVNATAFAISIAVAFVSWHLYEKQWLKLKNLPSLQTRAQAGTGSTVSG